jgi:DNA-binding transcriptional ArsR family regulator
MVRNNERGVEWYAQLLALLLEHWTVPQIARKLDIDPKTVYYHLQKLQRNGVVTKLYSGAWSVDTKKARVWLDKESGGAVIRKPHESRLVEDEVRGHGFSFSVSFPEPLKEEYRRIALDTAGISFRDLNMKLWRGESFSLGEWKVWFTPNKVRAWYSKDHSLYSDSAQDAFFQALYEFSEDVLKRVEKLLRVRLQDRRGYKVETTQEHYALVKNQVAKAYRDDRRKLYVYDDSGSLWLITDFSHMVDELETVKAGDAVDDNRKVKDYFNGIKRTGLTPEFTLEAVYQLVQDRREYAENIKSHIGAIQELGVGVSRWNRQLDELMLFLSQINRKD